MNRTIGFCLKCRKKTVMNQLSDVILPITMAPGNKGICNRCGTIIFKIK